MGKLYLVPTPIGNLKDMTFRAIEILKEVDLILAEDTRTSGKLLKHFEISTHMQSHHMHNEHKTVEQIVKKMQAGQPALVNSGFPNEKFVFEGFLPVKKGRQTRFLALAEETRTIIFYESPHKLVRTLKDIASFFGEERRVSVSRELTKLYEETKRGTALKVMEYYTQKPPKGEIVLIVEGKRK